MAKLARRIKYKTSEKVRGLFESNNSTKSPWKFYAIILPFIVVAIIPFVACAHQPRLVSNQTTIIDQPDISQAFYGGLEQNSHFFVFTLDKDQEFYFGLLVPDIIGVNKDISAELMSGNEEIALLDGNDYSWKDFYEEYAGDKYYKGPDARLNLKKGSYIVKVSSSSSLSKYILVVGEKEQFPLSEITKSFNTLMKIKKDFFMRSPFTIFASRIGFYSIVFLLVIIVALVCLYWLLSSIIKNYQIKKKVGRKYKN